MRPSAAYSSTMADDADDSASGACAIGGSSASSAFCVSGSAARKMTRPPDQNPYTRKRPPGCPSGRPSDFARRGVLVPRAGRLPHAFGDDADLLDAGALGGVDDIDDVLVAQRAVSDDEHRLVLALIEDVPQTRLELRRGDVLIVDGDLPIARVVHHDLADVRLVGRRLAALRRQVDVEPLLRQRQRRHEDHDQHEQHVDERRDVHVGAGVRDFRPDDLVGAEVMMRVRHYCPPAAPPGFDFGSVTRPMSSTPAWRSWSIAVMTAEYSTSSSALMRTTFSFWFSRISLIFVPSSCSLTGLAFRYIALSLLMATTVCPCVSGLSTVLFAFGKVTLTPCCNSGATIIMMMSSTSMTSHNGVTLISDLTPPLAPPTSIAITTFSEMPNADRRPPDDAWRSAIRI